MQIVSAKLLASSRPQDWAASSCEPQMECRRIQVGGGAVVGGQRAPRRLLHGDCIHTCVILFTVVTAQEASMLQLCPYSAVPFAEGGPRGHCGTAPVLDRLTVSTFFAFSESGRGRAPPMAQEVRIALPQPPRRPPQFKPLQDSILPHLLQL